VIASGSIANRIVTGLTEGKMFRVELPSTTEVVVVVVVVIVEVICSIDFNAVVLCSRSSPYVLT
jgi:ABC-type polysaccharide transport system permease subunit